VTRLTTDSPHSTEDNKFDEETFESVKINAAKIEIVIQKDWASSVQEVVIKQLILRRWRRASYCLREDVVTNDHDYCQHKR
jgi:hypothetical protein